MVMGAVVLTKIWAPLESTSWTMARCTCWWYTTTSPKV